MPDARGVHITNPAFEAKHPRDKSGRDRGQFVDVPGLMATLGGEWDEPRGVWMVPLERRADLDAALADAGMNGIDVPAGMRPATPEDRNRLKVPPAWTDVFVADDPGASAGLVVRGTDEAGRTQSRYSPEHTEARAAEKFERIRALTERMDRVDKALSRDAGTDDDAAAVMLIAKMALRPGSSKDTRAKVPAFGASTLQRRHVQIAGDTVRLSFVGKEGVQNDLELEDPELARVLAPRLLGKAGDERIFGTNDNRMRRWFQQDDVAPGFLLKDLRTLAATEEALAAVDELPAPRDRREFKQMRNAVGDRVAARLGNTRTMALGSYVDPRVFRPWESTDTIDPTVLQDRVSALDRLEDRLALAREFGLEEWPEQGDLAKRVLKGAPDTQALHQVDGVYTAKRKVQHDRIVGATFAPALAKLFGDDDPHVQKLQRGEPLNAEDREIIRARVSSLRGHQPPEVLFLAGGPASGKSSALDERPDLAPPAAVTINPDEFKEQLPEYRRMAKGGEKFAAAGVHEESADIAVRAKQEAVSLGLNVVMDGTGDSGFDPHDGDPKFVNKITDFQHKGYTARALYVTVPTDEAIVRGTVRAIETGRWVPTPELRIQHSRVSQHFESVLDLGIDVELFDTSDFAEPSFPSVPDTAPAYGRLLRLTAERAHAREEARRLLKDNDSVRVTGSALDTTTNRLTFATRGEVESQIASVVDRWTGPGGDAESVRADMAAGKLEAARAAITEGTPTHLPVFRAVHAFDRDSERAIIDMQAGDVHDLGDIASFTEDRSWADRFGIQGANSSVTFEVEGARGLPVEGISNTPGEQEWLLNGELEILEVLERRVVRERDGQVVRGPDRMVDPDAGDIVHLRVRARRRKVDRPRTIPEGPRPIFRVVNGHREILDPVAYQAFLDKRYENPAPRPVRQQHLDPGVPLDWILAARAAVEPAPPFLSS